MNNKTIGNRRAPSFRDLIAESRKILIYATGPFLIIIFFITMLTLFFIRHPSRSTQNQYHPLVSSLKKSANQGNPQALVKLGNYYANNSGEIRTTPAGSIAHQYSKVIVLYKEAIRKNYTPAMVALGWLYDQGYGVTKNKKSALYWFTNAAKLGNHGIQDILGQGYEPNPVKGYAWLMTAKSNISPSGRDFYNDFYRNQACLLRRRMTTNQYEQAIRLAKLYIQKYSIKTRHLKLRY